MKFINSIEWRNGRLRILDQTRLPTEEIYFEPVTVAEICEAIQKLRVRGAPAIGIVAAYGLVLGARRISTNDLVLFKEELQKVAQQIKITRPTAVNLQWAIDRMIGKVMPLSSIEAIRSRLEEEAITIHQEDQSLCRKIGENGTRLFERLQEIRILTHCNAGSLATGGQGTALSVVYELKKRNCRVEVFADETRPLLQGARLTSWELHQAGIPVTVICDGAAATVLREKRIDAVIVGADRIAANGDTANKIGTYSVALAARAQGVPFYVAAPYSTFDFSINSGEEIPIEERQGEEIAFLQGRKIAPEGVDFYNPAFDVTPHFLISAIITDRGILRPPFLENAKKLQLNT